VLAICEAQAVLSESELLRAMFDVGYFPPAPRREITYQIDENFTCCT
jgi:hypothetical protein